jgi:hypothetical protein
MSQYPGDAQLAYCKFKTVNGSIVTQTNYLNVKIDRSIGSAHLIETLPFDHFDGDYNYYSKSIILANYTTAPSGLSSYGTINTPISGTVGVTITDPNHYYPDYILDVMYNLDSNVHILEPTIKNIGIFNSATFKNNISTGDNVKCEMNLTDEQGRIMNATFGFYGGNITREQMRIFPSSVLSPTYASGEIFSIDSSPNAQYGLEADSQLCCVGTIYYNWAGLEKSKSSSSCTTTNPTTNQQTSGQTNWLDITSITDFVMANPLQFVIALLIIVVMAPILMMLLR